MKFVDCPDRHKHTPRPFGYVEYHEWAAKKSKTHAQHRCPTCRLWAIWRAKKKKKKAGEGPGARARAALKGQPAQPARKDTP